MAMVLDFSPLFSSASVCARLHDPHGPSAYISELAARRILGARGVDHDKIEGLIQACKDAVQTAADSPASTPATCR